MTDITKIKITNDPYTGPRAKTVGKYHALFESLKIGQCLVLPVGVSVQSVQAALAKHVRRNKLQATVRMRTKCEERLRAEQRKAESEGKPAATAPTRAAPADSGTAQTAATGDAVPLRAPMSQDGRVVNDDASNEPTLKLGDINARLAPLSISGAGLAELDIEPLATDKNAKLYSEAQFSNLLCELADHLNRVAFKTHREQLEAA